MLASNGPETEGQGRRELDGRVARPEEEGRDAVSLGNVYWRPKKMEEKRKATGRCRTRRWGGACCIPVVAPPRRRDLGPSQADNQRPPPERRPGGRIEGWMDGEEDGLPKNGRRADQGGVAASLASRPAFGSRQGEQPCSYMVRRCVRERAERGEEDGEEDGGHGGRHRERHTKKWWRSNRSGYERLFLLSARAARANTMSLSPKADSDVDVRVSKDLRSSSKHREYPKIPGKPPRCLSPPLVAAELQGPHW